MRTPRFDGCRHCGEQLIASPVSELLPERVSPELRHLQARSAPGHTPASDPGDPPQFLREPPLPVGYSCDGLVELVAPYVRGALLPR